MDRESLIDWFEKNRRDLPWRRTSDPYAKWVSEVMLQQTRVDTVVPYYERFLRRFPSLDALAQADPDEVRVLWSGLGYYRRAQLMLQAAQVLVEVHGGRLPADATALRQLPGFGPYMTGAVASLAFDLPEPAVDGNVTRVLSRVHAVEGDTQSANHRRRIQELARSWAAREPAKVNEALIELGATVCLPRNPRCARCPLNGTCQGRTRADAIPPPRKRKPPRRWSGHALVLTDPEGRLWMAPRPSDGLFRDLWCVPLVAEPEPPAVQAWLSSVWPTPPTVTSMGRVEHVLTHRRLDLEVWVGRVPTHPTPRPGAWVALEALDRHPVPSLVAKVVKVGLPPLFRSR